MSRDWLLFLEDIRDSCAKILRYVAGMTEEQFKADERTFDAVIRNLEILGEASKQVPPDVRQQMPEIDWRKVAGLRDLLMHAYFGIDDEVLWDVVASSRLVREWRCAFGKWTVWPNVHRAKS